MAETGQRSCVHRSPPGGSGHSADDGKSRWGLSGALQGRDYAASCCYSRAIVHAVGELFDFSKINLVLEPGRSLVAEAGVIETEVVLVARKSRRDQTRWVYLDVGKFGGLAKTLNESIKYRFRTARDGETGPVVLAGPTCDSADILYKRNVYALPLDLACGDRIEILSAGAYTSSYASVGFNGFPPLRTYWL